MARSNRRRRFFLGAVLVGSLIACQGIVGLDEYDTAECSGGLSCADTGRTDGPFNEGGTDGPNIDGTKVDATSTAKVSWPHFKMPNYVQAGGADAGFPTENIQGYTGIAGGGGFQDNVSLLTWREPIPVLEKGLKSYEDAKKICAAATPPNTWRVPSRIELVTLLDLSRTNPAIDPTFASTEGSAYWTTSEVRLLTGEGDGNHWVVDFGAGGVGKRNVTTQTAAVRCIKGQ